MVCTMSSYNQILSRNFSRIAIIMKDVVSINGAHVMARIKKRRIVLLIALSSVHLNTC